MIKFGFLIAEKQQFNKPFSRRFESGYSSSAKMEWISLCMKQSAGLLLYKFDEANFLVLLVHPGGPFWKHKDVGAWSIPKGEFTEGEDPLAAAMREFTEETGSEVDGDFLPLGDVRLKSGKRVIAWALHHDFDVTTLKSNTLEMQWPPKSGRYSTVPEVDRSGWFGVAAALERINPGQAELITRLVVLLAGKNDSVRS